ncbi:hypothetical protein LEP1GSC074_2997 [Leptospira noguchii str. Hook]|nr:hypothetical protein LEP1GSC041_0240 [Leptospira noguchii str. 2006001870]EMS85499.1 hypothetical protein LEP1GSC074_2997 [Leptospira noguchii str. Hook]
MVVPTNHVIIATYRHFQTVSIAIVLKSCKLNLSASALKRF